MADIDFATFAETFGQRLKAIGYSLRRAEDQWPQVDRAMLSRAINGKTLSAGNFLLLCELAGLDPYAFLDREPHRRVTIRNIGKMLEKQMVTACVSHETGCETGADHG